MRLGSSPYVQVNWISLVFFFAESPDGYSGHTEQHADTIDTMYYFPLYFIIRTSIAIPMGLGLGFSKESPNGDRFFDIS